MLLMNNPIEISSVDGKALAKPIVIEVTDILQKADDGLYYTRGKDSLRIEKGTTYTIVGYEIGAFVCPPDWVPSGFQQLFHFRNQFIPIEVISKKAEQGDGP